MGKVLIDYHRLDFIEYSPLDANIFTKFFLFIGHILKNMDYALCHEIRYKLENRIEGLDWTVNADTMIGLK